MYNINKINGNNKIYYSRKNNIFFFDFLIKDYTSQRKKKY